ncbi:hypothetical protein DFR49_0280 [Hephaestia caeni]|uniref:Uncharacterized protein n=1 Tax=Hephaestia caeni TaxID=645617 RepID=A0A397PEV0_9SPHN|nr:hypothetical protein DFR49_0280 [Hephaestia caeni]
MREPSVRASRLAIAGGAAATIAIGAAGFFLGRATYPAPEPITPVVIEAPAPRPSPTPVLPSVWGRSEIVDLAVAASDALTSGKPLPDLANEAVGQRLDLVIPFGCSGPADETSHAPLRWRYDAQDRALRIHVEPTQWSGADWALAKEQAAASIEGFWIPRPWSTSDACPRRTQAGASGTETVLLPGQTLAVAQFTGDDERVFDTVQRVTPDEFDVSQGLRLRLRGRIDRVPGAGAVRCIQPAGSEQRPICVVAISLDEVLIENTATGAVLATWSVSRPRQGAPDL